MRFPKYQYTLVSQEQNPGCISVMIEVNEVSPCPGGDLLLLCCPLQT